MCMNEQVSTNQSTVYRRIPTNESGGLWSILLFSHNALEILRTMELFSVSPIIIIAAESTPHYYELSVMFSHPLYSILLYTKLSTSSEVTNFNINCVEEGLKLEKM